MDAYEAQRRSVALTLIDELNQAVRRRFCLDQDIAEINQALVDIDKEDDPRIYEEFQSMAARATNIHTEIVQLIRDLKAKLHSFADFLPDNPQLYGDETK